MKQLLYVISFLVGIGGLAIPGITPDDPDKPDKKVEQKIVIKKGSSGEKIINCTPHVEHVIIGPKGKVIHGKGRASGKTCTSCCDEICSEKAKAGCKVVRKCSEDCCSECCEECCEDCCDDCCGKCCEDCTKTGKTSCKKFSIGVGAGKVRIVGPRIIIRSGNKICTLKEPGIKGEIICSIGSEVEEIDEEDVMMLEELVELDEEGEVDINVKIVGPKGLEISADKLELEGEEGIHILRGPFGLGKTIILRSDGEEIIEEEIEYSGGIMEFKDGTIIITTGDEDCEDLEIWRRDPDREDVCECADPDEKEGKLHELLKGLLRGESGDKHKLLVKPAPAGKARALSLPIPSPKARPKPNAGTENLDDALEDLQNEIEELQRTLKKLRKEVEGLSKEKAKKKAKRLVLEEMI